MAKIKGLFVNQKKAQCSIYEVGVSISNILKANSNFDLDYVEADTIFKTENDYDFCVVNWHHTTLPMRKRVVNKLPGLKIGINFEVLPDNCLPLMPDDLFDAYMIIDPTKRQTEKLFPFFRPLEVVKDLRDLLSHDKVVVGGFGFHTNGEKRYEEVVENFGNTDECIIRLNFPYATFMPDNERTVHEYAVKLKKMAKKNVDLRITHEYMSKIELVQWCSEHTINIFPYYRGLPGLSAVTDQALSAGRAIGVTACDAFRHLHKYMPHYPLQSYKELITSTLDGVRQIQKDWHPNKFNEKFNELLTEKGII